MPSFAEAKVRGIWVSTVANLDFPTVQGLSETELRQQLDSIVSTCKRAGINTVFFQVRPAADALYRSSVFPWSRVLSGTQGVAPDNGFDPLEYIISACHDQNIALHAWINPYRVCKASELDTLCKSNPALIHPEYTVTCSDGNVYFDPALEKVRDLVTDGVVEILEKYDVDGIHFDDYFYPYNVTDYPDAENYKRYGSEFDTVADFRRNNVDLLIKQVHDAVKDHGSVFGVSPFGIWNNSDEHTDGSDTNGMSSYSGIYADSRLWVKNKWVDYICPQVYWSFENTAAPFETVVRWWNDLCSDSDVDLYIGHAAYKLGTEENGWDSATQLTRQLDLCESLDSVDGNVFFRYTTLFDNVLGCADAIAGTSTQIQHTVPDTPAITSDELKIMSPSDGYKTTDGYCSISGISDPDLPLYVNGDPVQLTQNGYFTYYLPLSVGKNTFTFSNSERSDTISIIRTEVQKELPDCFYESSAFPVGECWFSPDQTVTVCIDALPGSEVHAVCAGQDILLAETVLSDEKSYYSADITMPSTLFSDIVYGNIAFYALRNGVRYDHSETATVTVSNSTKTLYAAGECYVYNSPFGGSMMDNYQLSVGTVVKATAFANGSYRLLSGKWINKDNLSEQKVSSRADIDLENYQKITLTSDTVFESYACVNSDGVLTVELYGMSNEQVKTSDDVTVQLFENGNNSTAVIKYGKKSVTGFYLKRKNDTTLEIFVYTGNGTLVGKTVAIDPGHGGTDCGALGPVGNSGASEAELNLSLSLKLANKLAAEGAKVYLTRTTDATVPLNDRAGLIRRQLPDISISVHHNSLSYASDFAASSGPLVFYSRETAAPLADAVASALGCESIKQSLNVCRDYRYPCILVECGFVCNPVEYEKLLTDDYKTLLCERIVSAISDYFVKNS